MGNDLHYPATTSWIRLRCAFEEIAHLLVHGPLTRRTCQLQSQARALRGLPGSVKAALNSCPPPATPWMLRTGVCLGCAHREGRPQLAGSRDIADRLLASLGSMLLYWYHFSVGASLRSIDDESIGGHFLHLLRPKPQGAWVRAMHVPEPVRGHEFNASTFTARVIAGTGSDMYSSIAAGAIGARPQHGGANEGGV